VPEDAPDPQEDCLFLDVFVPLKVYLNPGTQVPVLFWIFGGGYGSALED
jgi:carboxylesterase type B